MSLTILADENIPAVEHYLGAQASIVRANGRAIEPALLDGIDILLVRSVTRVDEALLAGSRVKFVGTATSGFDHVDRDYLAQSGVAFAHAPGSNANSVVEYLLAAIATLDDKLEQLRSGGVLGIVGYGVIGKAVAERFAALGIRYRVYDPWLDQSTIPYPADLQAILDCDVVSLHAELTRQAPWPSHHLLGIAEIGQLRPDALLVNASRGPVIDNAALLARLEKGRGPKVVLDVWEDEPHINAALLGQAILGTAHIAGYSLDGKLRATQMLSQAITRQLLLPAGPNNSPAEQLPALLVPTGLTAEGLIRSLIKSRYDIRHDDALLREVVAQEQWQCGNGAGFDLLRKSYRSRRELAGSAVSGLQSPEQIALAYALGCTPTRSSNSV